MLAAVVLVGTGAAAGVVAADGSPNLSIGADDATLENDGAADPGPPSDLPGPVPDFVGDLLETIDGFLSGALDDLGDAVRGVAAGAMGGA